MPKSKATRAKSSRSKTAARKAGKSRGGPQGLSLHLGLNSVSPM